MVLFGVIWFDQKPCRVMEELIGQELALENLAVRRQRAALVRTHTRRRLQKTDHVPNAHRLLEIVASLNHRNVQEGP